MINQMLTIGGKVEVSRYNGSEREFMSPLERPYKSQLLATKTEERIWIKMPTVNDMTVFLDKVEQYELVFYSAEGLYRCIARLESQFKVKQISIAVMFLASPLERYQRRQYFRMQCTFDMTFWIDGAERLIHRGIVTDISGGGARFRSKQAYKEGTMIRMHLDMPDTDIAPGDEICAKIISGDVVPDQSQMVEMRVEFLEITGKTREDIVKYVFEEERKQRQQKRGK